MPVMCLKHTYPQSVNVQVQFTPRLDPEAVRQEALKLAIALAPQTQESETLSSDQPQDTDQQPSPVSLYRAATICHNIYCD